MAIDATVGLYNPDDLPVEDPIEQAANDLLHAARINRGTDAARVFLFLYRQCGPGGRYRGTLHELGRLAGDEGSPVMLDSARKSLARMEARGLLEREATAHNGPHAKDLVIFVCASPPASPQALLEGFEPPARGDGPALRVSGGQPDDGAASDGGRANARTNLSGQTCPDKSVRTSEKCPDKSVRTSEPAENERANSAADQPLASEEPVSADDSARESLRTRALLLDSTYGTIQRAQPNAYASPPPASDRAKPDQARAAAGAAPVSAAPLQDSLADALAHIVALADPNRSQGQVDELCAWVHERLPGVWQATLQEICSSAVRQVVADGHPDFDAEFVRSLALKSLDVADAPTGFFLAECAKEFDRREWIRAFCRKKSRAP